MSATLQPLLTTGWLAEEPAPFRDRIVALGRMIRVPRGRTIYATGDQPDAVFGIAAGYADLSLAVADEEEVLIYRAGPGFWIGDSALLARTERGLTVTAVTDCDIFRLPGPAIRAHLSERPEDWPAFFRLNHRNAMLAISVLAEHLSLPPAARFARTMLRIADSGGIVTATQEDLARLSGLSRASFRRAMGRMIAAGVLRTGYGRIIIADRARLTAMARHAAGTGMAGTTDRA